MPNFTNSMAQMYVNARPQFMAQSPQPGRLPSTGTTKAGWGPVGQGLGEGFSDVIKKAYVEPQVEAMRNESLFNNDPNTMYKDMINMYTVWKDMPKYLQDQVSKHPGFQAKLQKYDKLFPGYMVPDERGQLTFASPVLKVEEQKAHKLDEMSRDPEKSKLSDRLLFSEELLRGAQTEGTEAETKEVTPFKGQYYKANADLDVTRNTNMNANDAAERAYKRDMGTAALMNAASRDEAAVSREALAWRLQQNKEKAAEDKLARQQKQQTEQGAYATFHKDVQTRMNKVMSTGMGKDEAPLDNASDAARYIYETRSLIQDPRDPQDRMILDRQVNIASSTIKNLAATYTTALKAGKDPLYLATIRQRAQEVFDMFNFISEGGRTVNPLNNDDVQNAMQKMQTQRTVKSFGKSLKPGATARTPSDYYNKEYVIPSNLGWLNRQLVKTTGRYLYNPFSDEE